MTILANELKLIQSTTMLDTTEGGGAPSSVIISDGGSNEIFDDISELDRAGGKVSLRKIFSTIQANNQDAMLGMNVIVADAPKDPNVSVTIFSTQDSFDRREVAKQRVEAYLNQAQVSEGVVFENHIRGQKMITVFQRPESDTVDIGATLCMIGDPETSNEYIQYVRVVRIESKVRKFYDVNTQKDYQARVVNYELSDALRFDFKGSEPNREFKRQAGKALIRECQVADAGNYYGITKLEQPLNVGDVNLDVSSVFTQLVPSAQTETPLINLNTSSDSIAVYRAKPDDNGKIQVKGLLGTSTFVGTAITPETLTISNGYKDDGKGQLLSGTMVVGTVDYPRGIINLNSNGSTSNNVTFDFQPTVALKRTRDTDLIAITPSTQALNYVKTLTPPPALGTMIVSYRSQGKWYDLRDTGDGLLKGANSEIGAGTISYFTGTVQVTLGALPDVGSSVLFSWSTNTSYIDRSKDILDKPYFKFNLKYKNIITASIQGKFKQGNSETKFKVNGDLSVTIDGSPLKGTYRISDKQIMLPFNSLPIKGSDLSVTYLRGAVDAEDSEHFVAPIRNTQGKVQIKAKKSLIPSTLMVKWNVIYPDTTQFVEVEKAVTFPRPFVDPYVYAYDDGNGSLKLLDGASVGTVDYSTGAITFNPDVNVKIPRVKLNNDPAPKSVNPWVIGQPLPSTITVIKKSIERLAVEGLEYVDTIGTYPIDETGTVDITYLSGNNGTSITEEMNIDTMSLDLTPQYQQQVVSESATFFMGKDFYIDTPLGLVCKFNTSIGTGNHCGSIDYKTGVATITEWAENVLANPRNLSLVTSVDLNVTDAVFFRVPVSPIRAGSLQLIAKMVDGTLVNVTADAKGIIKGKDVNGKVDYETGVVSVLFGELKSKTSGNSVEFDYTPKLVMVDSLLYNAVAYSYLPIDAKLLGLDPVRLPSDGRVPIFKRGQYLVIGKDVEKSFNPTVGVPISLGEVRVSRINIFDKNGVKVTKDYAYDLDKGEVTFTTLPETPIKAVFRVEDMAMISDVQISGRLSLTRPITHDYELGSVVSSVLVAGDVKVRIPLFFTQYNWDNKWTDYIVGNDTVSKFNFALHPMELTNKGAITERWCIKFLNPTSVQIIGEHIGVVDTLSIANDIIPINPSTNTPYFILRKGGWGTGWVAGNILRFNTVGTEFPIWVIRTVKAGSSSIMNDSFSLLVRGDIDRLESEIPNE